jgi:hypothetical protein
MSLNRLFGPEIKTENGLSQRPLTIVLINFSEKQVRLLCELGDYKIPRPLYSRMSGLGMRAATATGCEHKVSTAVGDGAPTLRLAPGTEAFAKFRQGLGTLACFKSGRQTTLRGIMINSITN